MLRSVIHVFHSFGGLATPKRRGSVGQTLAKVRTGLSLILHVHTRHQYESFTIKKNKIRRIPRNAVSHLPALFHKIEVIL